MEIKNYDSPEIIQLLANAFSDNAAVPVIGAGFTHGCTLAHGGQVPCGEGFKSIMIKELLDSGSISESDSIKLKESKFSTVSSLFFDSDFIPHEKMKNILKKKFHNVLLDRARMDFLQRIDWPYLYTLNIDDAIESHSNYKVVLPFNKVSRESKHNRNLYKMHGDINYEINHDDSKVVFSSSQYMQSIESNKHMLSIIKSDFTSKTIIYIGCSLDDELELSFINSNNEKDKGSGYHNMIFLCEDIDIIRRQELKSCGIDYVVKYDKGQHQQVYQTIYKAYSKSLDENPEYVEFTKKVKKIGRDVKANEDFLIKGIAEINERNDNRLIPHYAEERDVERYLIREINKEPLVVIIGRNFSGRTQLIYSASVKLSNKEVFIVDSKYAMNKYNAKKLIERENAVVFFDSGSVDEDICREIYRSKSIISENNSSVVVVVDKNNLKFMDVLDPDALNSTSSIYLKNKLTQSEVEKINRMAYEVKIPKFHSNQSILQNIYNSYEALGENNYISNIRLDERLFKILYLIGIQDSSATGESLIQCGLDVNDIKSISSRFRPFIEVERVTRYEMEEHSGFKITCYSKAWIYSILRRYYIEKADFCVESIAKILLTLKEQGSNLFVKGLLFDTINELFTGDKKQGAGKGAGNLILNLYDRLEELVSNEPEFHVQRSKAYYNIFADKSDIKKLDSVIKNLKFTGTYSKSESTERNIKNQLALIHLKKCHLYDSIDSKLFEETVTYCYRCIHDETINSRYVKELLSGNSTGGMYLNKFLDKINDTPSLKLLVLKMKDEYDFITSRRIEFMRQENMESRFRHKNS
ncbi:SIR2 family protein, partial [Pseudoalteromonas sp. MMG022]|uniref:SIR2 family NAD-dependent protein deacylase n=1 Tax=Pseudoalteromonas sp. MMG022 TaxID=2909978 RepID=UPI001F32A064